MFEPWPNEKPTVTPRPVQPPEPNEKQCQFCKNIIRYDAIKCSFCHEWIEKPEEKQAFNGTAAVLSIVPGLGHKMNREELLIRLAQSLNCDLPSKFHGQRQAWLETACRLAAAGMLEIKDGKAFLVKTNDLVPIGSHAEDCIYMAGRLK